MKKLKEYPPFWVGIVGGVVGTAVVAATVAVGSLGLFDEGYEVEFANTGGIKAGDEVRVAGIGVGEVTETRLERGRVVMSFRADPELEIGARSTASIRLTTLLGGRFVDLKPRGGGDLPDDRIPLANTEVPYNLQDVVQVGTPSVEKLDAGKLRDAFGVLADDFRGTPKALRESLDGLGTLSDVVSARADQLSTLIQSADTITTAVNDNQADIFTLMGQSDTLLQRLLERRELLSSVLTDFRSLSEQVQGLIDENRPQLKPLMSNLNGITAILKRNDRHIDKAIKMLTPAGRYVANATGNGPYGDVWLPYAILPDNLLCTTGAVEGCK